MPGCFCVLGFYVIVTDFPEKGYIIFTKNQTATFVVKKLSPEIFLYQKNNVTRTLNYIFFFLTNE